MTQRTYQVDGMTCAHCVAAVSGEVGAVAGVSGTQIDLASGRLIVAGDGFSDEDVRAAVDEAGYALVR